MTWRDYAACLEAPDPGIFFPKRGRPRTNLLDDPRSYCRRCPVQRPCLEYALNLPQRDTGIWADTNERQRRDIRRLRRVS